MKVRVGVLGGRPVFITRSGGVVEWADGTDGVVSYDADLVRMVDQERWVEVGPFDRIPASLTCGGRQVDDDEILTK